MKMRKTFQAVAEAMPTREEVGQELGNRVTEAKGFIGNALSEIGTELGRLGLQGQAEMAGALFNGNAYVPYGDGQDVIEPQREQQQEMERGGMER